MREIFLIGRILLGGYFLYNGIHHFTALGTMSQHVGAQGVPLPGLAVVASGLLLTVAGLSFVLGVLPRLGVAAIVLFLVPVTLIMHQFWTLEGPARLGQLVNFTKNIALMGASLMLVAVPEPWPYSLTARMQHLPRQVPA